MPPLEDFLRRFRPLVAPPGLAGPSAVPVDRTADLLAELAGVLEAVDRVEDEIARLEATARTDAGNRIASGRAESARSIARASELAPQERAAAYDERRTAGESEIRGEIEAARREARRIRRQASARLPELADIVVHRLLDGVGD
jgi:hypothetical protein